jgi:hypothetical protein
MAPAKTREHQSDPDAEHQDDQKEEKENDSTRSHGLRPLSNLNPRCWGSLALMCAQLNRVRIRRDAKRYRVNTNTPSFHWKSNKNHN